MEGRGGKKIGHMKEQKKNLEKVAEKTEHMKLKESIKNVRVEKEERKEKEDRKRRKENKAYSEEIWREKK